MNMNRENIIRMAREAGWDAHHAEFDTRIQNFAALVASAEREYLRESFRVVTAAEASAAILHEREACAKVCEEMKTYVGRNNAVTQSSAQDCATAIRARGKS
jgi:hypothetical protein